MCFVLLLTFNRFKIIHSSHKLGCGVTPQFVLCLKRVVSAIHLSLNLVSSHWLPLGNTRFEEQVGGAAFSLTVLWRSPLYEKARN